MSPNTTFLSRLIGIYCILVGLAMGLNKAATVQMVTQLVHDAPVLFVFGLVIVAAGVAMVLSHNIWSGGALPVIVTLVGWLTLIKGLAFLFFPPPAAVGIMAWGSAYEQYYYVDVALAIVLGIYLTYTGFKAR
jgi:hypothetical protein